MHSMRVQDDVRSASDIRVDTEVESNHRIHRDDLPQVRDRLRQHLRGNSALFLSEHRIPGDNGSWIWVRARGRVVERDANGRALRVAGTARNITHSRHAERERRIASEVLRSMNEAVSVLDRDFNFVSVNPAFSRMTGYGDIEVIGRNASLLDSAQHDPGFYTEVRMQLERHGRWSGEMWQQRKDGDEFLCAYECSAVLDGNGQHALYVVVLSDITDQKRAEQELRYLANYDTLTNLPNRTLLAERLSRARSSPRSKRHCCSTTARKWRSHHRSASACIRSTPKCPPNCSSRPTPRCTRPRPPVAAPTCVTPTPWTSRSASARRFPAHCARCSIAANCGWCTSPGWR
jgi:PAS domain S-box-containing protein